MTRIYSVVVFGKGKLPEHKGYTTVPRTAWRIANKFIDQGSAKSEEVYISVWNTEANSMNVDSVADMESGDVQAM